MSQSLSPSRTITEITIGPLEESPVTERPPDPEERRDSVRAFTTGSLLVIFGLTLLFSFIIVIFYASAWTNTKELIQIMLPAETALIGSVIGFYFSTKSSTSSGS